MNNSPRNIIFFDGVCNLCNTFVDIIIKLDSKKLFYFAPVQGETARKHSLSFDRLPVAEQSIYYLNSQGVLSSKSTAVIDIFRHLCWGGRLFLLLKIIPLVVRDSMYSFLAKNRYLLLGKKTSCRVPSASEIQRFLE